MTIELFTAQDFEQNSTHSFNGSEVSVSIINDAQYNVYFRRRFGNSTDKTFDDLEGAVDYANYCLTHMN